MSDGFRSFASILTQASRPEPAATERPEPPTPPPIMPAAVDAPPAQKASPQIMAVLANFAAEVVRLRARAAELLETETESLLQMIASRVLVRELELAPADVEALIATVVTEWNGSRPLRFRVAESDLDDLRPLGETLVPDPSLQPGDLQVEIADGVIDLRLGTRLAAVLETHRIAI